MDKLIEVLIIDDDVTISLDKYAKQLAEETLNHFVKYVKDADPFDGDETEYIAKRYLHHLDELMGNK